MHEVLSNAAATVSGAAAFFVVVLALGVMLGSARLRDGALRLVGIAVVVALGLRGVAGLVAGAPRGAAPEVGGVSDGGDALLCIAVAVGHVVLALVLLLRWLRPRAGQERAEERRRARSRERVRVPPRDVELDP